MATQSYHLTFSGYWREPNISGLPAQSGIYCVYGGRHNVAGGTVTLDRLIYIGESENVRNRVANHEKWLTWRQYLTQGQQLIFSAALILTGRERAEAAMIHHHKPPANTEYVDSFPYDTTTVSTSGQIVLLSPLFTVHRTAYGLGALANW